MGIVRQAAKAAFAAADMFLASPPGPRILIYHQVGSKLGRQMEVRTKDFEWQMRWLSQNREVVDLETAVRRWSEPGSERLVVLSFDDGYADTYTTAFPRIVEFGFPFTLYLSTEAIEAGTGEPQALPLAWESVASMLESGLVTIGTHTHTHRDLRSVTRNAIEDELTTSDEIIERRLGVTPLHFAYPWGYWSESADSLVRERYETAVLGGSPRPSSDPGVHRLHRYPVQLSDGSRFFDARLNGGLLVEEAVRRRLRGYRGP